MLVLEPPHILGSDRSPEVRHREAGAGARFYLAWAA